MSVIVAGKEFEMKDVFAKMDNDILKVLDGYRTFSDQQFVDMYCVAHRERFGEEFTVN